MTGVGLDVGGLLVGTDGIQVAERDAEDFLCRGTGGPRGPGFG